MIDLPCVLLGIYHDGWLIGFDDPRRGLDLTTPCYVPEHWINAFSLVPYDPATGELAYGPTEYGPAFIRLTENCWEAMPARIAKVMKERERAERAEAAAANKAADKHPRVARRTEDRMLRARNEKKRRTPPPDPNQIKLFEESD